MSRNTRSVFKPPPSSSRSEEQIIDGLSDGPLKDKVKTALKNLDTTAAMHIERMEKEAANARATLANVYETLMRNIPEHHLNMNFHQYMDMLDKESKVVGRQSFLDNVRQIGGIQGASCPTSERHSKPSKKASNSSHKQSATTANGPVKKKHTSAVKKLSGVMANATHGRSGRHPPGVSSSPPSNVRCRSHLQRAASIRGASSMVSPLVTNSAIFSAGAFTPKFDPRLPITPCQGLRKPRAGEEVIIVSKGGSPLSNEPSMKRGQPAIVIPLNNGKSMIISQNTILDGLNLGKGVKNQLKTLQKNMARIHKMQHPQ